MIANSLLRTPALATQRSAAVGASSSVAQRGEALAEALGIEKRRVAVGVRPMAAAVKSDEDDSTVDFERNSAPDCDEVTSSSHAPQSNFQHVIFVLLVPKGVDASELSSDTRSLLTTPNVGNGLQTASTMQVDVPSQMRLSKVRDEILAGIARASHEASHSARDVASVARVPMPALTRREREVLLMILQGHPNKNIAADLKISMRTVENHRAKVMKKTGSKSLPALVQLAIGAGIMPSARVQ